MGCYMCGTTHVKEFHFSGNRAKIRETGGFGRINDDASVYIGILQPGRLSERKYDSGLAGKRGKKEKALADRTGLSNGG